MQCGHPCKQRRLPVVLSQAEVAGVLAQLHGEVALLVCLLYGTGMRISEALQLRVKDVDFEHRALIVREGMGSKDRIVMLPECWKTELRTQLTRSRIVWSADVEAGTAGVEMPHALDRKYPRASQSWAWYCVFPQDHHSTDASSTPPSPHRHALFTHPRHHRVTRAVPVGGMLI